MTEEKKGLGGVEVTWAALLAALTMAISIVGGAIGVLNWGYVENTRLRAELTQVRIELAANAVSKNEFKEALKDLALQIDARLARIENKLSARP